MFLQLNHKKLEIYKVARELVKQCYQFTKMLPPDEKFALSSQIRRAALSVKLNISEGASRKSETERKRFYEISRGSLIEIDAAFESACDLSYFTVGDLESLNVVVNKCFALLTGLIDK
jgi:four helix bundle protein